MRKSLRVNKAHAVVGIRATSDRAIRRCARTDDKRQFFLLELSRELSPIIAGEPIGHMARKKLIRRLPPLPAKLLRAKDHKTGVLVDVLRRYTVLNQREEPQMFHTVRAVAKHFHVPISLALRVYEQLETEGLLVRIRGSKTLLQGRSSGRHFSVLGFIGMPAAMSAFVAYQDYRMFFVRVRRELRLRGFAVAMVLFEPRDVKTGQLLAWIEKHDFDTVLWYQPDTTVREIVARLKDAGIQIVGIADVGLPAIRCRYEIRRESAIKTLLHDWHTRSGIKTIGVVRGSGAFAEKEQMLEALIVEEGLTCEFLDAISRRPETFLDESCKRKDTGLIFPSRVASVFAFRAPEALMTAMNRCRVAFTGGPPTVPFAPLIDVPADLVLVDWQLIAEQIVSDLISKDAFDRGETRAFDAKAVLHAPLNQYAQSL